MFLCDNIDVYVFMCYAIVMICFMFRVIKNTAGHQGDSAHLRYPDKDTGGRSTLVLNF